MKKAYGRADSPWFELDRLTDMSIEEIQRDIRALVAEREWGQFHSPENLAKSISIEAGELLERFQWGAAFDEEGVREELADVMTYCLLLGDAIDADPLELVRAKLQRTRVKYPVDKARGRSDKYDQL